MRRTFASKCLNERRLSVKLKLIINTDGACKGNPGPGGYAAILQYREKELEVVGFDPDTTNNGM